MSSAPARREYGGSRLRNSVIHRGPRQRVSHGAPHPACTSVTAAPYHVRVDSEPPEPSDAAAGADPGDATLFLQALAGGDQGASAPLLELVYSELRRQATTVLRREREGHTLQPTALVHEAWMRLVDQDQVEWQNRAHFLGVASLAMRRVVVDHARARRRAKRGGGARREPLHTAIVDPESQRGEELDVLALNEGLEVLAEHSERAAKVVELRFFAGLTEDEAARVLGVARPTVTRDWRAARAWLSNWLEHRGEGE